MPAMFSKLNFRETQFPHPTVTPVTGYPAYPDIQQVRREVPNFILSLPPSAVCDTATWALDSQSQPTSEDVPLLTDAPQIQMTTFHLMMRITNSPNNVRSTDISQRKKNS